MGEVEEGSKMKVSGLYLAKRGSDSITSSSVLQGQT